ncbi:hypothetical protein CYMTET_33612, partial [Cymbomonas tetramitiformis]
MGISESDEEDLGNLYAAYEAPGSKSTQPNASQRRSDDNVEVTKDDHGLPLDFTSRNDKVRLPSLQAPPRGASRGALRVWTGRVLFDPPSRLQPRRPYARCFAFDPTGGYRFQLGKSVPSLSFYCQERGVPWASALLYPVGDLGPFPLDFLG